MAQPAKKRLLSLDVMRGATIAAMILVNNPGDWGHIYPPLEHSVWDGCTPTDLIFPFFLFMVGVSVVYAMETRKQDAANHSKMLWSALRRAVILIAISWCTQLILHPGFATLRFPGVLPRIALVFFICTVLYIKTSQRTRDWIFAACLIVYYILMCFVPVPGHGPANLQPETNLGAWVDRTLLTPDHLWSMSRTWDPEGLLGTIPAVATGLFGIRVGSWLKKPAVADGDKVSWLFVYGFAAFVAGMAWGLFFPVNKALWTSSFVLYTGGLATLLLAFCYWVIDVKGKQGGIAFFVPFGINAITAYVLSIYIPHYLGLIKINGNSLYALLFAGWLSPANASMAMGLFWVGLIWVVMWVLWRKKVLIKI